jgi:hypothetical protein
MNPDTETGEWEMGRATLVLAGLFIFALPALGAPSCETLKKNWKDYYYDAFGVEWGNKDKLDCPGGESKLAEALYHLHAPTFPANAPKFYQIAGDLVSVTRYGPDTPTCANDSGNFAYAERELGRITLCKSYFENTSPEYSAASMMHEARHLHAADPSHVTCDKGAYQGQKMRCDQKFYIDGNGGGFAWDVYYWAWAKNATSHELSNWVLQSYINERVPDRFNEITAAEVKTWRQD